MNTCVHLYSKIFMFASLASERKLPYCDLTSRILLHKSMNAIILLVVTLAKHEWLLPLVLLKRLGNATT